MVSAGKIARTESGVYHLTKPHLSTPKAKWDQMLEIDDEVKELTVKHAVVKKIQRSQKLRDSLVNYYQSRCQVCDADSHFRIPTDINGRDYVEVHHIKGLAESYALQQGGLLVGMRVNGLGNLTVLCPHHHATVHHYSPAYQFDREKLRWRNSLGHVLAFVNITNEHAALLQQTY